MTRPQSPRNRTQQQIERRLLSEWVAEFHANDRVLFHVHVGAIDAASITPGMSPGKIAMIGVRRRWVDAVIVYSDRVELIEAKVIVEPEVVGQIELYLRLWPATSNLGGIEKLPASGVILAGVTDPAITSYLLEKGLQEIVYSPPWVGEYLAKKQPQYRQPAVMNLPKKG